MDDLTERLISEIRNTISRRIYEEVEHEDLHQLAESMFGNRSEIGGPGRGQEIRQDQIVSDIHAAVAQALGEVLSQFGRNVSSGGG